MCVVMQLGGSFCLFVLIQFCCRSLPDFEYYQASPELNMFTELAQNLLLDSQS